ncbi:MAG: kynureninase [SAR86 cluster bacterium]|uniref:Kynureninase n=1 Tax=SAR86 cluster bacterium TaxID=2030880 RepID=A0A2A4WS80_9GAMM|nr:MAG: kynureninase [SAR86 cluster bacterium]
MNTSSASLQEIKELDQSDPLSSKRGEFLIPADIIYLNGNSLGPLTKNSRQRAQEVVQEQWGKDLIASWNTHAWIDLPFTTGEKIAKLIGAAQQQLVCCDSVSINLLKVLASCLQMEPTRNIILSQEDNFPTDLYVAQGLESLLGPTGCKLKTVAAPELAQALDEDVAVLFLTQVNFRNGDKHDIKRLTSLARARGILVVWDLSHSVGVLPLQMDEWEVDFAVGCGYKYLNGGPGAPAFIYANKKHHAAIRQPIQGWMGHREPFTFDPDYKNAAGMAQFLTGTPAILSLAVLDSALDIFTDITVTDINRKANSLAELFLDLVKNDEDLHCLTLESKADSTLRGAQLAFSHPDAYGICRALNKAGVVVDFRNPDIVRFGFSPLFLRFEDIWRATQVIKTIVKEKTYLADEFSQRLKVT